MILFAFKATGQLLYKGDSFVSPLALVQQIKRLEMPLLRQYKSIDAFLKEFLVGNYFLFCLRWFAVFLFCRILISPFKNYLWYMSSTVSLWQTFGKSKLLIVWQVEGSIWMICGCFCASSPEVSLLKGDIIVAETCKRMKEEKLRASQARQRRREQEWHQQRKEKLKNFLEKHDFDPLDLLRWFVILWPF